MKKKRITYGVKGLMEYQAVIKSGKSQLKVHFKDGTMNAMGVIPATFTTSNFIVQQAIERSADYSRGLIQKVSEIELDDELVVSRNAAQVPPPLTPAVAERFPASPGVLTPQSLRDSSPIKAGEQFQGGSCVAVENGEGLQKVEVSDVASARDYLADKYGISRNALRSTKAIIEQARAQGIEFEGI